MVIIAVILAFYSIPPLTLSITTHSHANITQERVSRDRKKTKQNKTEEKPKGWKNRQRKAAPAFKFSSLVVRVFSVLHG